MKDEDIDQRHAAAYHEAGQAVMVFYSRLSTGTRPHERPFFDVRSDRNQQRTGGPCDRRRPATRV